MKNTKKLFKIGFIFMLFGKCTTNAMHYTNIEKTLEKVNLELSFEIEIKSSNDLDNIYNIYQKSPDKVFYLLLEKNRIDIFEQLVKNPEKFPNLNINAQNSVGNTPLNIACEKGLISTVETLLKNPEIFINLPNLWGHPPLFTAITSKL